MMMQSSYAVLSIRTLVTIGVVLQYGMECDITSGNVDTIGIMLWCSM